MKKANLFLSISVLCACSTMALAQSGVFAGNDSAYWELNNGTLTISGKGDIPGANYGLPYRNYLDDIKAVVIEQGLTGIGYAQFNDCVNLTSVLIPNTVTKIGADAFKACEKLESISIPSSVKSIGEGAFYYFYDALQSVTVNWTKKEDLPDMEYYEGSSWRYGVFFSWNNNAHMPYRKELIVPAGTKDIYTSPSKYIYPFEWAMFANIIERSVAAEPTAIRSSRGSIGISLTVPSDGAFKEAKFNITLPDKFALDENGTAMAEDLRNNFAPTVTSKGNGLWTVAIKPAVTTLRSAAVNAFREIITLAYTVEKGLSDGKYELKISDVEVTLSDDEKITEPEILIPVTFEAATANEAALGAPEVWSSGATLHVRTASAAKAKIYSIGGELVKTVSVAAGETSIALPAGIYIVNLEGAEAKKVIIR
ncbi:MAG: leucine-rich repeat domain-containing protein [Tannerella sp.]|jgi:hypothetical protein|nr:leucine-rich repeat domain-containing protein [Tannerella sp.]